MNLSYCIVLNFGKEIRKYNHFGFKKILGKKMYYEMKSRHEAVTDATIGRLFLRYFFIIIII